MNIRSLHVRLILWYTGLALIVSLGFCVQTYYSLQYGLYGEIEEKLTKRAYHMQEHLLPLLAGDTAALGRKIEDDYLTVEHNNFIRVSRGDGTVLFASAEPMDHAFNPSAIPTAQNVTATKSSNDASSSHRKNR